MCTQWQTCFARCSRHVSTLGRAAENLGAVTKVPCRVAGNIASTVLELELGRRSLRSTDAGYIAATTSLPRRRHCTFSCLGTLAGGVAGSLSCLDSGSNTGCGSARAFAVPQTSGEFGRFDELTSSQLFAEVGLGCSTSSTPPGWTSTMYGCAVPVPWGVSPPELPATRSTPSKSSSRSSDMENTRTRVDDVADTASGWD
mmetsp:Transcript_37026/g.54381  ORF Transcript_37026/g.54381 Transcript_37026/m.54381 type:complete len:200 (-) Transcript_37026:519-1118(-)